MKRIIKSLIFVFAFLLFSGKISAADIKNINMDIYIDNNGDAHITETWSANINQGTEGYRFYGNLGNSKIIDYSVSDKNQFYTTLSDWQTSASFEEKKYKAGIYHAVDHDELCFGISNYGNNTYTLKYTITGFVADLTDSQMIYWELIPQNLKVDSAYIKIYSDFNFEDTLDVWGYGNYGGYAYVYDGYIEMSNDNLNETDYMTILAKFPKGTFNTTNVLDDNFETYMNMAEEGAKHYEDETWFDKLIGVIVAIFNFIVWIVIMGFVVGGVKKASNKCGSRELDFGELGKKFPKDDMMFRELPCGKDIYRAYWLAYNYKLMKKETDFLGAVLLKWTKQNKIEIQSETKGTIFKKENTKIFFKTNLEFDTELEKTLYNYMYEASKDGILESHEFETWCNKHYKKILDWFDKVLDYESDLIEKEGKLTLQQKTTMKVFKSNVYKLDNTLYEEAHRLNGLKNFFNDIENMKDKEAIEVNLWEEYLMYAQIFGVADKVAKQFKEMYPNVITDETYNSMIYVNTISRSGMNSASAARSRAESYSAGGGGFSSGGGGGGSFGGGGGGGFR